MDKPTMTKAGRVEKQDSADNPHTPVDTNSADSEILLQLKNVHYRYPRRLEAALKEVSITCLPASSTAILGPNGAGKSTLLDLCLGWKKPQGGEIHLAGKELGSYGRQEMGSWMSLVPQDEQVRFDYSVIEYLLLGRTPYLHQLEMPGEKDLRIAEKALETVGLPHLAERSVGKLSGGEHQLLLVARALVQQPKILILDEPTSRLDPSNRRRITELLLKLNREGKTLLFTTHDPSLAAEIAGEMVLLKAGRVHASGSAGEMLTGEHLSELYDTPIRVLEVEGRRVML
ncbi:MAG: ABC transporter ATP-binding protein [Spirochaetaceae bacterium]